MQDITKKIIEEQERLRRAEEMLLGTDATQNILKRIENEQKILDQFRKYGQSISIVERHLEDIRRFEEQFRRSGLFDQASNAVDQLVQSTKIARATAVHLDGIRHSVAFGSPALTQAIDRVARDYDQYKTLFELPPSNELARLAQEASHASSQLRNWYPSVDVLQTQMGALRFPWLEAAHQARSAHAFAELAAISHALAISKPYEPTLSSALREGLGDWQDTIQWPGKIFSDPIARSEFYIKQGFNSTLTNFPTDAFDQSLAIVGLSRPNVARLSEYESKKDKTEGEDADEENLFARNRAAFDQLQRLETQLRRFIDEKMAYEFGPKWFKRQVPGDVLELWREKNKTAVERGEPNRSLLAYADFTDYIRIFDRSDNWERVFKKFFRRKEDIRESLQRLYPIRICTMHARIISDDDEIFLRVESYRILKVIGASLDIELT
jgi:hypothetical protein